MSSCCLLLCGLRGCWICVVILCACRCIHMCVCVFLRGYMCCAGACGCACVGSEDNLGRGVYQESAALFFETGLTSAGNSTVRGGELPCQPQRVSLSPPPQDWDSKCRTHSLLSPPSWESHPGLPLAWQALYYWTDYPLYLLFLFLLLFTFLRQGLAMLLWLIWNSLFRPGWPQTFSNFLASGSQC